MKISGWKRGGRHESATSFWDLRACARRYDLADLTCAWPNSQFSSRSWLWAFLRSGICEIFLKCARMYSQIWSRRLDLLGWSRSQEVAVASDVGLRVVTARRISPFFLALLLCWIFLAKWLSSAIWTWAASCDLLESTRSVVWISNWENVQAAACRSTFWRQCARWFCEYVLADLRFLPKIPFFLSILQIRTKNHFGRGKYLKTLIITIK